MKIKTRNQNLRRILEGPQDCKEQVKNMFVWIMKIALTWLIYHILNIIFYLSNPPSSFHPLLPTNR